MCTTENLELFSKALYPVRFIVSLYLFVAGCIIAGNFHLAQAFGRGMTTIGAFLIVCCFWNFGAATIMHAGNKRHNKCIILVALCLDLGLAGVQLTLGSVMYMRTLSEFSESLELDCLLKVPSDYTVGECLEYMRSDRYAGMMLVWRSYTYLAIYHAKYYQRLVKIEQGGTCCGFGPPTRCTEDLRDFPSWASTHDVVFSPDTRYVCGPEEDWYAENYFCSQNVDEAAFKLVTGGCRYDFPMGDCMDIDVNASDTVRGCASKFDAHMTNKIFVHSLAILALSSFLLASLLSGCCMFWKRSYDDSIPDHVDRHVPWDPFKDKGPLGEDKRPDRREGGEVKLDPLGVLIMGEMVDIHRSKVIPI